MVLVGKVGDPIRRGAAGKQVLYSVCLLSRARAARQVHGQPAAASRGVGQVSRGCLVCLYRRESH